MKVCCISANLGAYDQPAPWPELDTVAGVSVDVHRFDDTNLPPRPLAMTSRLQCGIPKWWGYQMRPGYDAYIWIDASCTPTPCAVIWFLSHLKGGADIAAFRHPDRQSVQAEYEFMAQRMARPGETYLNARYKSELLKEQYEFIAADRTYPDDRLYASTAFVYRPTLPIRQAFQMVWAHKARFLLHDQLVFCYALWKTGCDVSVIDNNYLKCPALAFTRIGRRRGA